MTSPRTENDTRPGTDPEPAPEKPRVSLSVTQVCAGALAAVSAAVLASFFGVAGTVIGAALVSVVSTVGSALYSASLNRTGDRLRKAREQLAPRPVPASGEAPTRELPARLDPRRAPAAPRRRIRWPRVAGYAAAVFVLAMGIVTTVELIGRQPVSALVGGTDASSSSTTIGELSNASSSRDVTPTDTDPTDPGPTDPADTSTEAPAPGTPEGGAEESATPTDEPDGSAPATGSGTGDDGEDAEESAPAEPSTQAPQTGSGSSSDSGSGSGSGNGSGSSPQADAGTGTSPAA
ncbi:hypothetical protein [Geodermatophilus normandii]|uniref:Uncharacterized protein n=1 Tax=Geodermatophilus normandii TaxID=1137989 RepID=A0A6P0GG72_9ACTN|nr:hypothetical protein [Geodermatophilus normandii]NEM06283.1 hypothetical protein [Geodermatophilus normandii]